MDQYGTVFRDKVDMGNQGSNNGSVNKRKEHNGNNVSDKRFNSFSEYLYAFNKSEMATAKVVWWLFNLLGWPSAILTLSSAIFGDIMLGEISEPYKSVVLVLGIIFLVVKILIAIEHYREKRILNREREFELFMKKDSYEIKHNSAK